MAEFSHNNVDIYIKERNGKNQIRVPWLPASIEYVCGEQIAANYDILNRGTVAIPTGTELATVTWTSQFPGINRKDKAMLRGSWKSPSTYDKRLKRWLSGKTELNVTVTGFPINLDVTLTSYEAKAVGGFGDIEYTVTFTEDRDLTITKSKKRSSKKYTTYTVKKKDSLWKIAKKTLGAGSKWKKIYTANKKIIEKTAKKHGHKSSNNGSRIYAGTKLKIPKS